MKGILKLVQIEKPEEGMQATFYRSTSSKWIFCTIHKDQTGFSHISDKQVRISETAQPSIGLVPLSELKQIVVEYTEWGTDEGHKAQYVKILPLHPEDWEKALPLIGKEVEFEVGKFLSLQAGMGVDMAKLILPKQEESWHEILATFTKVYPNSTKAGDLYRFLRDNYHPPKPKQ